MIKKMWASKGRYEVPLDAKHVLAAAPRSFVIKTAPNIIYVSVYRKSKFWVAMAHADHTKALPLRVHLFIRYAYKIQKIKTQINIVKTKLESP
jgi:hypothetical protein